MSLDVLWCHMLCVPNCPSGTVTTRSGAGMDSRNSLMVTGGLPTEDRIDARENELKAAAWDLAYALGELLLIQGDE